MIDRVDRIGGRLFFSFWGVLILLAVFVVAVPVFIGTLLGGEWAGVAVSGFAIAGGLLFGRYLLSSKRRLSEIED